MFFLVEKLFERENVGLWEASSQFSVLSSQSNSSFWMLTEN